MQIELLDINSTGNYLVETASGTVYLLNMDEKTGTRYPDEDAGELWADGEPWVFDYIFCELKNSMMFDIPKGEGEYTWRTSTYVTKITPTR